MKQLRFPSSLPPRPRWSAPVRHQTVIGTLQNVKPTLQSPGPPHPLTPETPPPDATLQTPDPAHPSHGPAPESPSPATPPAALAAGLLPRTLPDTRTRNPPPHPSQPHRPKIQRLVMHRAQRQPIGNHIPAIVGMPPDVRGLQPEQAVAEPDVVLTHGASFFVRLEDTLAEPAIPRRVLPDLPPSS